MPVDAAALRRRCAEEMDAAPRGFGNAAWLRDAFLTVPREHFAPARVWWPSPREDGLHSLIDQAERPNAWLEAVYSTGAPLITQMDDGRVQPTGPAKGYFSSSISSSGVIIELLRHLAPRPGERVLELGTGTGYTTALLATRTGPGTAVSIEVDPAIAAQARRNLDGLGLDPLVITGDGEQGHQAAGPYDRIVAIASVRRIPRAWLEQLRPGGVLLAPLDSPFGCDLLVRLTGAAAQPPGGTSWRRSSSCASAARARPVPTRSWDGPRPPALSAGRSFRSRQGFVASRSLTPPRRDPPRGEPERRAPPHNVQAPVRPRR
ncbi:methyltransferase domain-containing protein [Streptomyces cyaneofuscatus]|uniref:methyltransferase domain-containing protein n=1 Tax=Streptomyces cyaneofuscatus TaxID=66883 RepID=UPI0037939341